MRSSKNMNHQFILIICLLFTLSNVRSAKVHVTILYESLCPDSIKFMQYQLGPTYHNLKAWLDITFVPFGKAHSVNGGQSFVCQHGQPECEGNMIQACVQDELKFSQDLQTDFTVCQMSFSVDRSGKVCAERFGVPFIKVQECLNSGRATQLLLAAEDITKQTSPQFIPTIIFNHVFDQRLQDRAIQSFKSVVCELIQHSSPTCHV